MKPTILCLATGFEEMEALAIVDVLRRAGLPVQTMSVTNEKTVIGAHNIPIVADMIIEDAKGIDAECIALPGGLPGAHNLRDCKLLGEMITKHYNDGKKVAAICAAPLVFGHLGISKGHKMTCYPGFEKELTGATTLSDGVVNDGQMITGKGPAYAIKFGLEIAKSIAGEKTANEVAAGMLVE